MRMISHIRARLEALRSERGFSMIIVMGVMAASSLFVAAAFAAANGDLPLTRDSQDRKQAYAAAEAGINFYQYHLNQDPDYWTKCTAVPRPNTSELNPVNEVWNGAVGIAADPRRWRSVAGLNTEYTIEMVPANGYPQCVPGNAASMVNQSTGAFKIRSTGRPRAGSKLRRTLVAQFRRKSFLDFLYFTEYETVDPLAYDPSEQDRANNECAGKYRASRTSWCDEIRFADADSINGPFHTNDSILTCGTPIFGRNSSDPIEFMAAAPGWTSVNSTCGYSGNPTFNGPIRTGVTKLTMPSTNSELEAAALPGYLFTGTTKIRFNGPPDNNMTVWKNYRPSTNTYTTGGSVSDMALPTNGVIYVKTGTGGCGAIIPPANTNYGEPSSCGNLYVSGTYTKSMTLGSKNDIVVMPDNVSSYTNSVKLTKPLGSDHVLGLIANNFVRVYHKVDRDYYGNCQGDATPVLQNVTIESAILTLAHSFVVDNWTCGQPLQLLTVTGAIAQQYRGAVGTVGSNGSGYIKNYNYDDRLRYRSPPYFLTPVAAAWGVVRSNEQVPAR
jgi:Tfp pilus assembly protein PilX